MSQVPTENLESMGGATGKKISGGKMMEWVIFGFVVLACWVMAAVLVAAVAVGPRRGYQPKGPKGIIGKPPSGGSAVIPPKRI